MVIKNNIKVKADQYAKYMAIDMEMDELILFINTLGIYVDSLEELIFLLGGQDLTEKGKKALILLRNKLNRMILED